MAAEPDDAAAAIAVIHTDTRSARAARRRADGDVKAPASRCTLCGGARIARAMPLFSRSKSSKSGVTVEAGATPPSSKASSASAPAPASSGAQRLQFSFAPPDALLCMHLQQNARGSGWEPCLNGSAVDAAWFETDWLPNLQAAHAAAVLFSDKYRAEFSVALAREARALLTRRQRDPAFKLYVVTANNDKETAVITGCAPPPPPPPPPPPALPPRRPPSHRHLRARLSAGCCAASRRRTSSRGRRSSPNGRRSTPERGGSRRRRWVRRRHAASPKPRWVKSPSLVRWWAAAPASSSTRSATRSTTKATSPSTRRRLAAARSTASPTARGRRATWTGRSMWASGSMG